MSPNKPDGGPSASSPQNPQSPPGEDSLGGTDPRDVLALLEAERAQAAAQLIVNGRTLFLTWGVAWLLGFLGLYLSYGAAPVIPPTVAGIGFSALLIAAIVGTMIHTGRRARGVRGRSSAQGAMYGFSWFLGFVAMTCMGIGMIAAGMDGELAALYYPSISGLIVGLLYLGAGNMWQDRVMYGTGVWILAAFSVATLFGAPTHYLLMSILGGGGFIVAGLLSKHCQPQPTALPARDTA